MKAGLFLSGIIGLAAAKSAAAPESTAVADSIFAAGDNKKIELSANHTAEKPNAARDALDYIFENPDLLLDSEKFIKHIASPEKINADSIYKLSMPKLSKYVMQARARPTLINVQRIKIPAGTDAHNVIAANGFVMGEFDEYLNLITIYQYYLDEAGNQKLYTAADNIAGTNDPFLQDAIWERNRITVKQINAQAPFACLHELCHAADYLDDSFGRMNFGDITKSAVLDELASEMTVLAGVIAAYNAGGTLDQVFPNAYYHYALNAFGQSYLSRIRFRPIEDISKLTADKKFPKRWGDHAEFVNHMSENPERSGDMDGAKSDAIAKSAIAWLGAHKTGYVKDHFPAYISQRVRETAIKIKANIATDSLPDWEQYLRRRLYIAKKVGCLLDILSPQLRQKLLEKINEIAESKEMKQQIILLEKEQSQEINFINDRLIALPQTKTILMTDYER